MSGVCSKLVNQLSSILMPEYGRYRKGVPVSNKNGIQKGTGLDLGARFGYEGKLAFSERQQQLVNWGNNSSFPNIF